MPSHMGAKLKTKESLQHFSHDHPLIYVEDQENPKANCSACGVAFVSSPSYKCSQGCNFFLHRPCKELLQSTKLKFGGHSYELSLLAKPPRDDCKCDKCGNSCNNFTYKCSALEAPYPYPAHFYLHCQCAFPLEINIKHISHHEHELMAMCKEASLVCDACGKKQDGIFFSCQKCSFYIHQDCCSLTPIISIKHHRHPLFILYSLRSFKFWYKMKCIFCGDDVLLTRGAYVCGWCSSVAHLHCAASAVENTGIVQESVNLPSMPDTFSSLITRAILENREDGEIEECVKPKIEKYHTDHSSWTLHHRESDDFQLVCNACILPIISSHRSYYSCPQQCFFLLHESCANLPPVIKNFYLKTPVHLFTKSSYFCSVFSCDRCHKDCNGFGYKGRMVSIDVQCATSPNTVKHESHKQHLLTLSTYAKNFCCCDGDSYGNNTSYSCGICDHHMHPNCAFLPKTVKHKFDEHPLELTYNLAIQFPREEEEENEHRYLCEICEEDINPKFWFYYCGKCDQSFHVNCIPSTGKLSKIKFGCNIDVSSHVHDHPVTLTRMLTMGTQKCGYCKDMVQGFVDDMAFHCSKCNFWIHFDCARKVYRNWRDN